LNPFENINLEQVNEYFLQLYNDLPNPLFVKNKAGEYVFINRELELFWQTERSQVIGKTDFDLLPKDEAQACVDSDQISFQHLDEVSRSFENQYDEHGNIKNYISVNKRTVNTAFGQFLIGVVTLVAV